MSSKSRSDARIRFDGFEADLRSGELFKDGRRVALPNQSFLALAAFLERPGQLVTREELRARLWPDNRVVEFEQGLNAIINRLREALGDSAGNAKFIETLPRRGYKFIGTIHAGSADGRRRRARIYGLAIGLCAAVAAVIVVRLYGSRAAGEDSNFEVGPLTSLIGREVAPAFAPDGERLLFGWNGDTGSGGRFDLYSKSIDSEKIVRLTHHSANAISAAWAPGGKQVAFARTTDADSGVYLMATTGGAEQLLAPAVFLDEPFMQLSFSPDGRLLAYSAVTSVGASVIHVLTLDGHRTQLLERPPSCLDAGASTFSPDGRQLAFVCTSSVAVYGVYVTVMPAGRPKLLASLQGYPQGLAWTSDGRTLIVANDAGDGSSVWRLTLSGRLSLIPGAEEALGPGVSVAEGRIAFVREKHLVDIWRADLTKANDSGNALISSTRMQLVPQYSPDGARVAFQSTRSGSSEIWLADADGRNPVRLTSFKGPLTGAPSWCNDGRRIAFDSRESGVSAIYVIDILEGRPHRLETSRTNLSLPVWSEDCRWIFASDGRAALYKVPVAGGAAEIFTNKQTYRAAVSAERIVFNVSAADGVELWSKPAEGGVEAALNMMPRLEYSDSWAATRSGIYYTKSEPRPATLWFYDFASQRTRVVRALQEALAPLGGLGIAVSRDERWLLYTRTENWQGDVMMLSERSR